MRSTKTGNITGACALLLGILLFLSSCSSWENLEKASERNRDATNNESTEAEIILFMLSGAAPGDGDRDVPVDATISITFDRPMDASTLTTNTSDTECKGNFKISAGDFETCAQMKSSPTSSNSDQTYTITPLNKLDCSSTYKIAINTKVQDTEGNSWEKTYISPKGFTTITGWIWVSGSNIRNQPGVYGIKGTADPDNIPGARKGSVSWTDSDDNLWLFGGSGIDTDGNYGYFNDLWKY